jgi:cytidylate kinase
VPSNVICISHATGADGAAVARRVADRLGFLYVDEEIVTTAAAAGGLSPADVADEERRKSFVARLLDALAESGGGAVAIGGAPPFGPYGDSANADVRALIRDTIDEVAARGNVVIGAHAASHALGGRPDTLRVLVTASASTRAKRVAAAEGIGDKDAERTIREADAARRDYLNRFYDVGDELPTHYDLVVNTDALSADDAATIVATAAS